MLSNNMRKHEFDPSELDRNRDRNAPPRRMKSPIDRRLPIRRESPMMSNRPMQRNMDAYDDYPPRPKERETHNAYKILCVANLNNKINDNAIRDALNREFSRFGEMMVKVCYDGNERFAYIYFRSYEEAREARHAKSKLILFDKVVEIEPIYEQRTLPSNTPSSRRRSMTPDYGPGNQMPTNQRTSNLRNNQSMMNNSPTHQPQNRRMQSNLPHQSNQQMMKPHHSNNYQRNYNNPMNNHDSNNHHNPHYDNLPPHQSNQQMMRPHHSNTYQRNYNNPMNNHHSNNQNNNHHNPQHHGNQNHHMRPQQRESKKDKFPNYLHHIPPEIDDKATRTLFVGNLEVTISDQDLKRIFEKYGSVEDIDVKRPPPGQGNAYAFIKFLNLDMAHKCKVEMSGQYIGKFQCKIGYGKCTPTTRIWVGGLGSWTSLSHLEREFDRFGAIRKIDFVKGDNHAYIQYDSIDAAQAACQEMRGMPLGGPDRKLRVDFADPEPYNYNLAGGNARPNESNTFPSSTDNPQLDANAANVNSGAKNGDASFNQRFSNLPSSSGYSNTNEEWNEDNDDKRDVWNSDSGGPQSTSPRGLNKRPRTSDIANELSVAKKTRPSSLDDAESDVTNFDQRNNLVISENVSTIPELMKCCPVAWNGGLILKSMVFPARMLSLCNGDLSLVELVDQLMKDPNSDAVPVLRITQRLRLDPVRLEDVGRRMSTAGPFGHCMLLTTAGSNTMQFTSGSEDGSTLQTRPLRNLVSYLKQKEAAGVVTLSSTKDGKELSGVLYVFPPCEYATDLLKKVAPNLVTDSSKDTKEEYLVIVVVKG